MQERKKQKETNQLKRDKQNRSSKQASKQEDVKKRNRKAYSKPNKTVGIEMLEGINLMKFREAEGFPDKTYPLTFCCKTTRLLQ